MFNRSKHLIFVLVALLIVISPVSVSAQEPQVNAFGVELPPDAAPPEEQVMRFLAGTGSTIDFAISVYDRPVPPYQCLSTPLVQVDKNYDIYPAAADSWEVSEDGLTWTFHLDPNLTWSDGTPVTAHDYVFTWQYEADPEHAYDFAWYWGFSCNPKNWSKVVAGELPKEELGVKAIDDKTLQITTEKPAPFVPATMIFSRPLAKHAVEKYGLYYNNDPATSVSSEPWILEEWEKDKRIVLSPNLNYTGKMKPYLERIIYELGDQNQQVSAYLADEIDWVEWFSPADIDMIVADPELSKEYHPGYGDFRTYYFFFDHKPPFDDVRVRQAFVHAIDKQALLDNVIQVQGMIANGMLMPGYPDAVMPEELAEYQKYDPELASQLLAEAGYPNGEGFPKLELWLRDATAMDEAVAGACASMLKDNLGIDVEISNKEGKVFMAAMNAHELQFGYVSYGMDYFDASNLLGIWKSGGRHAWVNEEFDRVFEEARFLMGDPDRRHELFVEAQHILSKDVGGIFIYHERKANMYKPYVKGEQLEPDRYGVAAFHWPGLESIGVLCYSIYIAKH